MLIDCRRARALLAGLLCLVGVAHALPAAPRASTTPRIAAPPAWVRPVPVETSATIAADELRQGVHYLLSDAQTRVDGADLQQFRHLAMKAVNEKGVEAIANVEIGFDPSYQVLTVHSIVLHRDGRVIPKLSAAAIKVLQRERELDYLIFDGSRTAHVFLDDVRVGDIVEYAYSLQGSNPVFGGRHFGQFDLQWSAPVHHVHARLLWPQGRPLQLRAHNGEEAPRVQDLPGHREHLWQRRTVPMLPLSSDTPAWFDPYPAVQWSDFGSWDEVVRWALPLYATPTALPAELQAEQQRIARAAATPAERLVLALNYVQRTVRYLGVEVGAGSHAPTAPATVLARRFGDCKDKTLLTLTLLRALGIEAAPALVNTERRAGIARRQPSPGAFNHVIVRARIDGQDHWLDPTRAPQKGRLETLAQSNFGHALVIAEGTRDLQAMGDGPATRNLRKIHVTVDAVAGLDQPVWYEIRTVHEGASAEAIRATLAGSNAEELQRKYLNYYAQFHPGISVAQRFTVEENEADNRLTIVERYKIADFWTLDAKRPRHDAQIYVPELKNLLQTPRDAIRQMPLGVNHPVELEHVTEIRLPEDWQVEARTERVDDPAFELVRKVEATPRVITLTDSFRTLADHVEADRIAAYAANIEKARHALDFQLYSDKTPAPADALGIAGSFNWAIALLALCAGALWCQFAWRCHRWDPPGRPAVPASEGQALGGWLVLMGLGLVVAPLYAAHEFMQGLASFGNQAWSNLAAPNGDAFHPLFAPVLLSELLLFIGRMVFLVLLLVLFFQRRRSLPRLYVIVGWAAVAVQAFDLLAMDAIPALASTVKPADWSALIRAAVVMAIWTAYLNRSQRVRETFVRGHGAAMPPPAGPPPDPPVRRATDRVAEAGADALA